MHMGTVGSEQAERRHRTNLKNERMFYHIAAHTASARSLFPAPARSTWRARYCCAMTLTSGPMASPSEPPTAEAYWRTVLRDGQAWASEHKALLDLVFHEFDQTGCWPIQDQLKRNLARAGRDFRILEAAEELPQVLGWVVRSSGEIVLKPLALSALAEAELLVRHFMSALQLAVDSYLGPDPSPKVMREQLQTTLDLDDVELRKLGKILANEHLWLGSSADQKGNLIEVHVSDRILEFSGVSNISEYLETSTRLSYPHTPVMPTALPEQLVTDLDLYRMQTASAFGQDNAILAGFASILHPAVASAVERHIDAGLYAEAVLAAYALVRDLVRDRSGLHELDGHDLFGKALSPDNPLVPLANVATKTGKDYQRSMMLLCEGVAGAIRNPLTHAKLELRPEEAIEMLSIMSLVYRRIAGADQFSP